MEIKSSRANTQTFNYVRGYYVDDKGITRGNVVRGLDDGSEVMLVVDHAEPITLECCAEILKSAEKILQRSLIKIEILWKVYMKTEDGDIDTPEECLEDKKFIYTKASNLLVIYQKALPFTQMTTAGSAVIRLR